MDEFLVVVVLVVVWMLLAQRMVLVLLEWARCMELDELELASQCTAAGSLVSLGMVSRNILVSLEVSLSIPW